MLARRRNRRRGMTAVEAALVLSVFLMLLFGMFEYCRFLFVLQVTNNAARDGARYAVVNLDKPSTFNTTDYTDASGNVYPSIVKYTTARMGGSDKQLSGFAVAAYPVDSAGLALSPPVFRARPASGAPSGYYPDPFNSGASYTRSWNDTGGFPNRIGVSIKGTYTPVLPSFLQMPTSIDLYVTATMGAEG